TSSGPKRLCTSTTRMRGISLMLARVAAHCGQVKRPLPMVAVKPRRASKRRRDAREGRMSNDVNDGKRQFLKAAMLTGAAGAVAGAMTPNVALAQMLDTGIREDSVLAKIRREGVINVGYAQTGPWFYKDAKTGELGGIYKDVTDMLAKE